MTDTRPAGPFVTYVVPLLAAAGLAAPAGAQPDRPETQRSALLEVLVLDRDGRPVSDLTGRDFVVTGHDRTHPVDAVEEQTAGEAPRRFVFAFNRRGADAAQLSRALRDLESFVEERMLDSDESIFVDIGETLRMGRAFGPGNQVALQGIQTIPAMGFRSPVGAEDAAVVASRMLEIVADRLAATPGRKILVLFSESLSSFSRMAEQPGTVRKSDLPRIRADARGEPDAGFASIAARLRTAKTTVHVAHLAGVHEFEDRILTATRDEYRGGRYRKTDGTTGPPFRNLRASTTFEARQQAANPRSGDDILSSLAAETGGLYLARATGFRKALDRIEARNRNWYRLTLVGEVEAGERESQVLQVRVPGCGDCTVLVAPNPGPE